MKQIDKIARELKRDFAGRYNDYYKSATIYLDTDEDCLYLKEWGQGESYIKHPKNLIPLCGYNSQYGNWGDDFGNDKNWLLTKKVIATEIKIGIKELGSHDAYFGDITIPEWLTSEIDFYLKK